MILKLFLYTQIICKMFIKKNEEYNVGKKRKLLIAFDDMIADMIKNLNPVENEWFIWGRKFNISVVSITQSYFKVPKEVRLNTTYFSNATNSKSKQTKKQKKKQKKEIALNHSLDIDFKGFMRIYKKYTVEP